MNPVWPPEGMRKPHTLACKTLNRPADHGPPKRRGCLAIWFDSEMIRAAALTGKRGRRPVCSGGEDRKTVRGTVFPTPNRALSPSCRRTGTPSRAKPPPQVQSRAPRPCGHRATPAVRTGDDGEGPARHWSEGGPERCHRRSPRRNRNALCEPKVREAQLPGQRPAFPTRKPQDKSVRGRGTFGYQAICATLPPRT